MCATKMLMTADELFELPDDGSCRYELVRGELRTMAPAGYEHGAISVRLSIRVGSYVEANDLGEVLAAETGFKIASDPDTVRAPDVAFVSRERLSEVGSTSSFGRGAPDLAVEVISPRDSYEEVDEKVADWLRAGTQLVWVVNPRRRTIAVHTGSGEVTILSAGDQLTGEPVLPGFSCTVAEIFPPR